MNRELLAHLPIVVAVAEKRGFAAAAQALGLSASAVSHAVRVVEDQLGEPLFARTTRSVALTEAGQRFLAGVAPALDDITQAVEHLSAARGEVSGLLRLNASAVASQMALPPLLARLAALHPLLTVEVHNNDALVDIVAQGFDAGIRLGEQVQQDMVSVRLTPPFKAIVVASPDYVARHGAPANVQALAAHNCIGFRLLAAGSLYDWELREAGETVAVRTAGSVVITDATFARELALAGVGLAYIFEPLVREELRSGRLQRLLPEAAFEEPGLFLYFPRRAAMAPKLRAFIAVARSLAQ